MEDQPQADAVRLSVPAALEFVRIVRLTGSGVASRLGFDVEEIENLRVALDELASMTIEASDGGELEVTFFEDGDRQGLAISRNRASIAECIADAAPRAVLRTCLQLREI